MTEGIANTEIGNSPTQIGNFPNIESLAAEHDRIVSKIAELPETPAGDEEGGRLNNRLWAIRALITATPVQSRSEAIAIARILQVEAARDPDFECHVPGSARDLARVLAAGVMALQIAA